MKKFLIFFLAIFALLVTTCFFLWMEKSSILSFYLSHRLGAPISMGNLRFYKGGFSIKDFHMKNIPPCKTSNAIFVENSTCQTTLHSLLQKRTEIKEIHLQNIVLGIEFLSSSGDQNNWTLLLSNHPSKNKSKNSHPYLIETIAFDNIHVILTYQNGTTKKVPVINHLEFHNISDDSGFPVEELEKAIFKSMIDKVFKDLGIKTLMRMVDPYSIPRLFHLPFTSHNASSETNSTSNAEEK